MTRPRHRVLPLRAAILLGMGLGLPWAAAAQSIPVSVGGNASSLPGAAFDLPLYVDMSARADRLGSFALALRWNPAVLEFVDGVDGTFGQLTVNDDSVANGALFLAGANPQGAGGLVVLGVGRFRPVTTATDTFRLTLRELYAATTFADLLSSAMVLDREYCPGRGRFGDVDPDGLVNSRDALVALMAAVGLDVSGFDIGLADVDADGDADPRDALVILSYGIGLDVGAFRVWSVAPGTSCETSTEVTYASDPGDATLLVGEQVSYAVYGIAPAGGALAVTGVRWESSAPGVAKVDSLGMVTAVAVGTATVRALRDSSVAAEATITVVTDRSTYWVDATTAQARNHIGSAELPFTTIQEAIDAAGSNDTVRVRPGRYVERLTVTDKRLVIWGDTTGGGRLPLIAAGGSQPTGLTITRGGRVEVHRLQFDTLYAGIRIVKGDTIVVRESEFGVASGGIASLSADSVRVLLVGKSRFFGRAAYLFANNAVRVTSGGRLVQIDSSVIGDYGDDGVELVGVDSLVMRGNLIRNNYGYGVSACNACTTSDTVRTIAGVFIGNRFIESGSGEVYLYVFRRARFERNVGYTDGLAMYLRGFSQSVVTILGDSLETGGGGSWLYLTYFDSLTVDSTTVVQRDDYSYVYYGKAITIRNSRFLELEYEALDLYNYPDTGTVVLRNVEFRGPDTRSCDRCGDGIYADGGWIVDGDSLTFFNLSYSLYTYDQPVRITNSTFEHAYEGIYTSCGGATIINVEFIDVQYGVDANGCAPTDSLLVDQSKFVTGYTAIEWDGDPGPATVTRSTFHNVQYGIQADCGNFMIRHDTLTADPGYYAYRGIYLDGCVGSMAVVDSVSVSGFDYGFGLYYLQGTVTNSRFSGGYDGLELNYGSYTASDNSVSDVRYYGVYSYVGTNGRVRLERNSVDCGTTYVADGIYTDGSGADTAILRENVVINCRSDGLGTFNALGEIRNNTVTMPAPYGEYGISVWTPDSLVRVVGNTVTGKARYGSIHAYSGRAVEIDSNTVTGSVEAGIYTRYIRHVRVRDNLISAHDTLSCCLGEQPGAIIIGVGQTVDTASEVRRNRITFSRSAGIVLQRNNSTDTVTVVVDSNAIRGASTAGIYVYGWTNALLRWNAVDSTAVDGVLAQQFTATATLPVVMSNNNLSRSGRYGVNSLNSARTVNAQSNYWNGPDGPRGFYGNPSATSGDSVSQYVDWSNYLTAPASTVTPAPAALPVIAASPFAPAVRGTQDVRVTVTTPPTAPVPPARPAATLRAFAAPPEPLRRPATPDGIEGAVALDRLFWSERVSALEAARQRAEGRAAERAEREAARAERRAQLEAERAARQAAIEAQRAARRGGQQ
jgi:hypothetical protein